MNLGFCLDSEGFGALWCSLLPDEFVTLTMSSANNFSPLSFSPVGEMQVTLVLSKTSTVNELQPPLVLKPILTFPKGRNRLPCFVNDIFSQ